MISYSHRTYLLTFLAALLLLGGCRKGDNPRIPDLARVPLPLITRDTTTDLIIPVQEPEAFHARFTVDLYFKSDIPPQKFDIVVIKNGNKTKVLTLQAGVTTFPTNIEITGPQLAELFGEPIVLGDKFDIGADITAQDGSFYPAFPTVGVPFGAGIAVQPGSSTSIRYESACTFIAADYAGDFEVELDEWGDYSPGDIVPVTVIDENHVSFEYLTDNSRPIIVEINLASNETSVKKQIFGDYGTDIINIMTRSVPSLDNYVSPCDGILSVKLQNEDALGPYEPTVIRLKKVD